MFPYLPNQHSKWDDQHDKKGNPRWEAQLDESWVKKSSSNTSTAGPWAPAFQYIPEEGGKPVLTHNKTWHTQSKRERCTYIHTGQSVRTFICKEGQLQSSFFVDTFKGSLLLRVFRVKYSKHFILWQWFKLRDLNFKQISVKYISKFPWMKMIKSALFTTTAKNHSGVTPGQMQSGLEPFFFYRFPCAKTKIQSSFWILRWRAF